MLRALFLADDVVFLSGYVVFALLLSLGYRQWLRFRNRPRSTSASGLPLVDDPYAIAYLRGGAAESVRTAVFALLYRGMLAPAGRKDLQRVPDADVDGLHPVERAVLARFDMPRPAHGLLGGASTASPLDTYPERLQAAGLLERRGDADALIYRVCIAALFLVAGLREALAIKANIGTFPLAIIAALIAWFFFAPTPDRLTAAGKQTLARAKGAHQRAGRHAASLPEATWAAAALGVAALSLDAYPMAVHVMPAKRPHEASGGDGGGGYAGYGGDGASSSSDACGSDSDSGGGGGDCGGGGDGGGGSSD